MTKKTEVRLAYPKIFVYFDDIPVKNITLISLRKHKDNMFCQKCSSLLIPQQGREKIHFYCTKCDKKYYSQENVKIKEDFRPMKKEKVVFIQKNKEEALPKTTAECPKCHNEKAYYWVVQTRSSDEAPTKFLKCVKCEHRWRDYG